MVGRRWPFFKWARRVVGCGSGGGGGGGLGEVWRSGSGSVVGWVRERVGRSRWSMVLVFWWVVGVVVVGVFVVGGESGGWWLSMVLVVHMSWW